MQNFIKKLKYVNFKNNFFTMDFSKAWDLMKLQQEATRIQKELQNTLIESEIDWLVITFDWEMKAVKVDFEKDELVPWLSSSQKENLQKAILEAINKWVKKSQEVAASKMQWIMGQMWMNLPGWMPPM